jgi:hypothetical protein
MPDLTIDNIQKIMSDISREEITIPGLLDELVDHVCCDIEYEMHSGLAFDEAYDKVMRKIGTRRFREIQEETLYAIDIKYRKMKTTMKVTGIAGTILLGFAALFKIQHWPGAGGMMTLGTLLLALVFMPSALGVLWKETHNMKKIFLFISAFFSALFLIIGTLFKIQHWPAAGLLLLLAAVSGIVLFLPSLLVVLLNDPERKAKRGPYITGITGIILFILGMYFKINHWPYSALMLVSGLIFLGVIALPWYTLVSWKSEEHISSKFIFLVTGALLILLPGTMVNLNLQYSYETNFIPYAVRQQMLNDHILKNNNSIVASYRDSSSYARLMDLHNRTIEVEQYLRNLAAKMVQKSEGSHDSPAFNPPQIKQTESGPLLSYVLLTNGFTKKPVQDFLMPESESRKMLEAIFKNYIDFVRTISPEKETGNYIELLSLSRYLPSGNEPDNVTSMITGLHSLEILRSNLLVVEKQLINSIIKKG